MNLNLGKLRVLLVEDLEPMREIMTYLLTNLGIGEVVSAANGQHALKLLRSDYDFDLIITDWEMPVIDGLTLTQTIRKNKAVRINEVPIILVTGFSSLDRIAKARDSGVNEYMIKPFNSRDLAKRIEYIIRSPRSFIFDEAYTGPNRRRKSPDYKGGERRVRKPQKVNNESGLGLQTKVGVGVISDDVIARAQRAMDENKVDFYPIASGFLSSFQSAIESVKNEKEPTRRSIENMISPIMQIKANALVFGYPKLGEIAGMGLNFLDNLNEIDQFAIMIAEGFYKPMKHMVVNRDDQEEIDMYHQSIKTELEDACKRYNNIRISEKKKQLQKLGKK